MIDLHINLQNNNLHLRTESLIKVIMEYKYHKNMIMVMAIKNLKCLKDLECLMNNMVMDIKVYIVINQNLKYHKDPIFKSKNPIMDINKISLIMIIKISIKECHLFRLMTDFNINQYLKYLKDQTTLTNLIMDILLISQCIHKRILGTFNQMKINKISQLLLKL